MISAAAPPDTHDVARHYDDVDPFYRELWGEHLHHGLWTTGRETVDDAVRSLVDLVIRRGGVAPGQAVCDVGCGYGGTARILAREVGADVTGFTVSEKQYAHARDRRRHAADPSYVLGDWLHNGLPDESFDVVVAVESTEHMPDPRRFLAEAFRVLRPGGRLVVCAWLAAERARPWQVRYLLEPICREGRLAALATATELLGWAAAAGFVGVTHEDLTARVRRTWDVVLARLLRRLAHRATWPQLRDPGYPPRHFAASVLRLWLAYRSGAMGYGVFTGTKPPSVPCVAAVGLARRSFP